MDGNNAIRKAIIDSLNTLPKKGKVTIRGTDSDTLDQYLLNSIWKQTGWK